MSSEHRSIAPLPTVSGRKVSGYAALFNVRSQNLGTAPSPWFEVVKPGAFPDLKTQDVRALFNHDPSAVLARSKFGKGTLRLSVDSKGLRYEFDAPKSVIGENLVEALQRGDVDQSSFGFVVKRDKWTETAGVRVREILEISQLLDVSPVTFPAYAEASSNVRHKATAPPTEDAWTQHARLRLRLISKL